MSTSFTGKVVKKVVPFLKRRLFHLPEQVQEELRRVIGSRQVQVEDRKNLHFTNAVVHETQRLANIAPTSLPHKTSQDITFEGHFIKKVGLNFNQSFTKFGAKFN